MKLLENPFKVVGDKSVIQTALVLNAIAELTIFKVWKPQRESVTIKEIVDHNNRIRGYFKLSEDDVESIIKISYNIGVLEENTNLKTLSKSWGFSSRTVLRIVH